MHYWDRWELCTWAFYLASLALALFTLIAIKSGGQAYVGLFLFSLTSSGSSCLLIKSGGCSSSSALIVELALPQAYKFVALKF